MLLFKMLYCPLFFYCLLFTLYCSSSAYYVMFNLPPVVLLLNFCSRLSRRPAEPPEETQPSWRTPYAPRSPHTTSSLLFLCGFFCSSCNYQFCIHWFVKTTQWWLFCFHAEPLTSGGAVMQAMNL